MKKIFLLTIAFMFAISITACELSTEKPEAVEVPKINVVLFESEHGESIVAKGEELFFGDSKYLAIDLDGDRNVEELLLGRNVDKSYAKIKGNVNTKIVVNSESGERQLRESYLEEAYDEYGELKNEYYIQLTAIDLDGNDSKEIVVSIGNNTDVLRTSVFTYDAAAKNSCEYTGFFVSEDKVVFDGEKMIADDSIYVYKSGELYKDDNGNLTRIVDDSFTDRDIKEVEKEEQENKKKRANEYFEEVKRVLKYGINTTYRYDIEELSKRISQYMSGVGNYDACISAINTIKENFDEFDKLKIDEKLLLQKEWDKVLSDVNCCREELDKVKSFLESGDVMKSFQVAQSSFSNDLYDSCSSFQEKVKNRLDRLD